jgi:S1-C subfamily serine protease
VRLVLYACRTTPAAAGLRSTRIINDNELIPGDIIQRIGNFHVQGSASLLDALDRYAIGDQVGIHCVRDEEVQEILVMQE